MKITVGIAGKITCSQYLEITGVGKNCVTAIPRNYFRVIENYISQFVEFKPYVLVQSMTRTNIVLNGLGGNGYIRNLMLTIL